MCWIWLCGAPSPETRMLVSDPPGEAVQFTKSFVDHDFLHPPFGGRAVYKSICGWGYTRRATWSEILAW